MTALVLALDSALLSFVWQGMVVAFLLWLALTLLRRASANARYLISCSALAVLAMAPLGTVWLAYRRSVPGPDAPFAAITVLPAIVSVAPAEIDWLGLVRTWMAPAWACGVLLLSVRMLWGCTRVGRLKRQGEAPDSDIAEAVVRLAARLRLTRPVRVLVSSLADGPSVVGWLRPVLLLPTAALLGLSPGQLEAVLAHELAHIRRYDYLVNLGQMLIETLFFYHPAVWWISRRIRMERELCCDDLAVGLCGDAVCYARALASLERMRVSSPSLALGVKDGPLLYRIERLLGVARCEPAPSRVPAIAAVCLGLICFAPVTNPVKAQAPLPPAPLPQAPALESPRIVAGPSAVRVAGALLQVAQSTPGRVPVAGADDVLVQVSVDANGLVNDARVISGPIEERKAALLQALSLRYPPQNGPGTRLETMPAAPPLGAIAPHLSPAAAQQRIAEAEEEIARVKAQQAQASERGAAQLQEIVVRDQHVVTAMGPVAAGQDPLIGAKLAFVQIVGSGATGEVRQQLLNGLPFRAGDILSESSMVQAVGVVAANFPKASAYFGELRDSGAGVFIVTLPYSPPLR